TARAGIVMVREGRRLFEELTAEENLLVGAALHADAGGSRAARLGLAYQYFPRLRDRRTIRAGYLSGGEQQMLAIGCARLGHPRGAAPALYRNKKLQAKETLAGLTRNCGTWD